MSSGIRYTRGCSAQARTELSVCGAREAQTLWSGTRNSSYVPLDLYELKILVLCEDFCITKYCRQWIVEVIAVTGATSRFDTQRNIFISPFLFQVSNSSSL